MQLSYALPFSCRRLWSKCQESSLPLLPTLLAYSLRRLRGRNLLCAPGTRIKGLSRIEAAGLTQIGMHHVGFMMPDEPTFLHIRGHLRLEGKNHLGRGTRLDVGPGGRCVLSDVFINARCLIVVETRLVIGAGSQIGWDVMMVDDNFHSIDYPGRRPRSGGITLGREVWVGARATVLAGTEIADGCVVAAGAVVSGSFHEPRTLIAGNPARVVRREVTWQLASPDAP